LPLCYAAGVDGVVVHACTALVSAHRVRRLWCCSLQRCVAERRTTDGRAAPNEDAYRELRVMTYLSQPGHPNLCNLVAVMGDAEFLYIVLEYMPGAAACCYCCGAQHRLGASASVDVCCAAAVAADVRCC
jgi:hypothetical protein